MVTESETNGFEVAGHVVGTHVGEQVEIRVSALVGDCAGGLVQLMLFVGVVGIGIVCEEWRDLRATA